MLKLFLLVQILFIPAFLSKKINLNESKGKLVSVGVIFRHGDRAPINPYPKDPYRKAKYWPDGFGQLTNVGKMQHFELGKWLRNHYEGFLSPRYSKKEFYIRSTDVDRTLMSAQANLAGLYPPKANQIWNKDLKWQPIPIHTTEKHEDNVLAMKMPCERYDFNLKKLLISPEFMQINQKNQELYDFLSRQSGKKIRSLEGLQHIYSTLLIETLHNYTLPNWTKKIFPMKLKYLAGFYFAIACYNPELARLKTGPLFNDILVRFNKATNSKGHKFFMYSGHDTTIANILNSLNVFEYHKPPFAAMIIFELRSLNHNFFVNILYKNTSVPQEITLKDCEYYCPLEKFEKIIEPIRVTPEKWINECKLKVYEKDNNPFCLLQNIVFICCMSVVFVMLVCFIIRIIFAKIKKRKAGYLRIPNENTNCYF